jgi:hypothetical protein
MSDDHHYRTLAEAKVAPHFFMRPRRLRMYETTVHDAGVRRPLRDARPWLAALNPRALHLGRERESMNRGRTP